MGRRRLDNLDPERQKALFEAAAEELAANGFDGASLNRILERSGMSKSSLYYYFEDKADLFTTMMERTIGILFRQIGPFDPEALTAETFWSDLERRYGEAVAIVSGNPWFVRFGGIFYGLRDDPKRGAATGRLFLAVRRWIGTILARGRTLGVVRSDLPEPLLVDTAMALFESLDRWVVEHWQQMSDEERRALPALHMGLFRDLLARK
ncbi:MAG: TetR/AcrR family transcriptional regulator [Bryobacterales bacterium]